MRSETWLTEMLDDLEQQSSWGYHATGAAASEPTALAALALLAHHRFSAANRALDWLAKTQSDQGYVSVFRQVDEPHWPTSLAILAWNTAARMRERDDNINLDSYQSHQSAAIDWLLSIQGRTLPQPKFFQHDTTIVAWPWVAGTHSWVEPTAMAVMALKSVGFGKHGRTRAAIRLLVDRLLPGGGCNYGNTVVMGSPLRPHLQPTGIALTAIQQETVANQRLQKSVDYLRHSIDASTPSISLSWSLIGLSAHDSCPDQALDWLEASYRSVRRRETSAYPLSLLALAAAASSEPNSFSII